MVEDGDLLQQKILFIGRLVMTVCLDFVYMGNILW